MGEGVVAVASPRPNFVGRALLVAVLVPHDKGMMPDIVA